MSITIKTTCGEIKGTMEHDIHVFKGIPYAEDVNGDQRFLPSKVKKSWQGIFDATSFGPSAIQDKENPILEMAENCLTLNVWTKHCSGDANLPVVVYVHGGAFLVGAGSDPKFNGKTFAESDIVYVTVNYRLGVFGFLHLGELLGDKYKMSGNCGIIDIMNALRWIKKNIHSFGGNPNQITLMGESAGAKCVAAIMAIQTAPQLISQVILQSGATQAFRCSKTATNVAYQIVAELGLKDNFEELSHIPVNNLLAAQQKVIGNRLKGLHYFGPVIDDELFSATGLNLIKNSNNFNLPALIGFNKEEVKLYTTRELSLAEREEGIVEKLFGDNSEIIWKAYDDYVSIGKENAWEQVLTDYLYRLETLRLATALAERKSPVWLYRFDWQGLFGAAHTQELPFVWNLSRDGDPIGQIPEQAKPLAEAMHAAWISFIKTGNPHHQQLPKWDPFRLEDKKMMLFNSTCRVTVLEENINTYLPTEILKL